MSANVDLVRSLHPAWDRGDYSSVERAQSNIEFVIADGPSPGGWTGLDGMAEGTGEWPSACEEFRQEVDEYRELDDERVFVLVHRRGRGKTSGLELGQMADEGSMSIPRPMRQGDETRLLAGPPARAPTSASLKATLRDGLSADAVACRAAYTPGCACAEHERRDRSVPAEVEDGRACHPATDRGDMFGTRKLLAH